MDAIRYPIQPPMYHAPEVILGMGWSYSAGIWNFGILVRRYPHFCVILH